MGQARRYKIRAPAGVGPLKRTYRVEDLEYPGCEKLLVLPPAELGPDQAADFFLDRTALEHPALLPLLDVGFKGRRRGFILPQPPEALQLDPPCTIQDRLQIALELSCLLLYLHRRHFLAGLISPEQLYGSPHRVRVQIPAPAGSLLPNCLSPRALRFCSPELLQGREITRASDLYSLGLLLYRIFTDSDPFPDADTEVLPKLHSTVDPVRPSKLTRDLPTAVEKILLGLIRKEPSGRLQLEPAIETLAQIRHRIRLPAPGLRRRAPFGRRYLRKDLRRIVNEFRDDQASRLILLKGPRDSGKEALCREIAAYGKALSFSVLSFEHDFPSNQWQQLQLLNRQIVGQMGEPASGRESHPCSQSGVRRRLKKLADYGPILLISRGLELIDESWRQFYERVLSELPLLLIGTCSSEESGPNLGTLEGWADELPSVTRLTVAPMSSREIHELSRFLLGGDAPGPVSRKIETVCKGRPEWLESLLDALKEVGDLYFAPLGWRWTPELRGLNRIPEDLADVFHRRILRLSSSELALIQILTLLGKPASAGLLLEIRQERASQTELLIDSLRQKGLVEVSGSLEEPVVELSHGWMVSIVTGALTDSEIRELHRKILRALPKQGDRSGPEEKLRHALGAESREDTERYLDPGIRFLKGHRAFRQAAEHLGIALKRGMADPLWWRQKELVQLLFLAGERNECLKLARSLLRESVDPISRAWLLLTVGRIQVSRGLPRHAVVTLRKSLELLDCTESESLRAEVLGELLSVSSRYDTESNTRSLGAQVFRTLSRSHETSSNDALCLGAAHFYRFQQGDESSYRRWKYRAVDRAFKAGRGLRAAEGLVELARHLISRGRWIDGERILDYCRELSQELENEELTFRLHLAEALLLRRRGKHRSAAAIARRIETLNSRLNLNMEIDARARIEIAANLIHLGETAEAEAALDQLEARVEQPSRETTTQICLLRAQIDLLLDRPEQVTSRLALLPCRRPSPPARLLLAAAAVRMDNLRLAGSELLAARREASSSSPAYETRLLLMLARLFQKLRKYTTARYLAREALDVSRAEFLSPLTAEAHLLEAELLQSLGRFSEARTRIARAGQICKPVGRPILKYRIRRASRELAGAGNFDRRPLPNAGAGASLIPELLEQSTTVPAVSNRESSRKRPLAALNSFISDMANLSTREQICERWFCEGENFVMGAAVCLLIDRKEEGQLKLHRSTKGCSIREVRQFAVEEARASDRFLSRSDNDRNQIIFFVRNDRFPLAALYVERREGRTFSELEHDYLSCLQATVEQAVEQLKPARVLPERSSGRSLLGEDPVFKAVLSQIDQFAVSRGTVLIYGESGTGKELAAIELHSRSLRCRGPFVTVNCPAIPPDLIESELFGHARGSFTGAVTAKTGLFEAASGGTIFLDEISSMPLALQARLLRVLQEKRIRPVGDTVERPVDVRVLAATNEDLRTMVEAGQFRLDLYHRLNVLQLRMPPLRERRSDIRLLARHFLNEKNRECRRRISFRKGALQILTGYDFPGNVRELQNLVESLFYSATGRTIERRNVEERLAATALRCRDLQASSEVELILQSLIQGTADFNSAVRRSFMKRDLSRREVRWIISQGLERSEGSYRRLSSLFGLEASQYKGFMAFLKNHGCWIDFRPFRRGEPEKAS